MAQKILIRNFSNVPLTLTLVERFSSDDEKHNEKAANRNALSALAAGLSITTSYLGLTSNNSTTPTTVALHHNKAVPFISQGYSVRIEPARAVHTDIAAFQKSDAEWLRLHFRVDDDDVLHQLHCRIRARQSADLIPNSGTSRRFMGVYLSDSACVALYKSSRLDSWMTELPGHLPLSILSIPGTHNSPTHYVAPPSVRCQAVSPQEQLHNGARFFDFRVYPENPPEDSLVLVHSVFPISLSGKKYFRDLYRVILEFLRRNPDETIIMSLKREGAGAATDQQLSQIIRDHYVDPDTARWYTDPVVPTLDQARGKIVLIRRFHLDKTSKLKELGGKGGLGLDASSWADNAPDSLCPTGQIRIQDFYNVGQSRHIDRKIAYCTAHMDRSGRGLVAKTSLTSSSMPGSTSSSLPLSLPSLSSGTPPFHLNFLSGSTLWQRGTWPERIAARVNPACLSWLCRHHMMPTSSTSDFSTSSSFSSTLPASTARGASALTSDAADQSCWSTGILICDWVGVNGDWDLFRCVVGMNARLLS